MIRRGSHPEGSTDAGHFEFSTRRRAIKHRHDQHDGVIYIPIPENVNPRLDSSRCACRQMPRAREANNG